MLKLGTVLCIASFVAIAYGFMISALFGTPEYANLVMVPLNTLLILSSGIYITLSSLWVGLAWIKTFSSFYYTFESLMILYWNFLDDIECGSDISCERLGPQALAQRGFDENNLNYNILALLMLALGMHVITLLAVIYRKNKSSTLYTRSTIFC
ncbi:scarlet [Carabus blaptoides fortunei]